MVVMHALAEDRFWHAMQGIDDAMELLDDSFADQIVRRRLTKAKSNLEAMRQLLEIEVSDDDHETERQPRNGAV